MDLTTLCGIHFQSVGFTLISSKERVSVRECQKEGVVSISLFAYDANGGFPDYFIYDAGSSTGSAGGYDGSGGMEFGGRGQFDSKDGGNVNEDLGGDEDSIDGNFSNGDDVEDSINDNDDTDFAKRA